jgi:DNA-directed RNA polymerase subunit N (RpoN/RPB10)
VQVPSFPTEMFIRYGKSLGDDMEQYIERLDRAQQQGDEETARKILDDLKVETREGMDRNRVILLALYEF